VFKVSLIDGLLEKFAEFVAVCKPPCRPGVLEKLLAKVNEAIAQSRAGDEADAADTLRSFIKRVKHLADVGKLSASRERALVGGAKDILEHIANSPST